MEKRHQDLLTNRLEEARDAGVSHVLWDELYRWYDKAKLAAGTYRDMETRWQELTEGKKGHLMQVEGRGGIFLFGSLNARQLGSG